MKARILVIEDEMSINDLLCMNLEIAGYETVGYLDGNEAYEAIIQDHAEYSRAMKSHFRKFGNQMSGSGNHLCNYASLLA